MGLDPGYRRLFVQYLKEYAERGNKTIFLTSHIIQDMEMLIDDCMILDYGRLLIHESTDHIINNFKRYTFQSNAEVIQATPDLWNPEKIGNTWEVYSFLPQEQVAQHLTEFNISKLKDERLSLEDAFIGFTGKY